MKRTDWGIEIRKVENGFVVKDNEGKTAVFSVKEGDELSTTEQLLWQIIEFFNLGGSRYDKERISVIRRIGDKYILREDEEVKTQQYQAVVRKQ